MLTKSWKFLAVLAGAATLACNTGKAPAEAALKVAEESVNSARAEAETLVPDDFRSLTDELAAAKDMAAKGDYKAALAAAQSIQQKANEVTAKAMARKEELSKSWADLSAGVPGMVSSVQARVDELSKARRLPKGIDAAKLQSAKDGLAAATSAWTEAQSAQTAGNWGDAVTKANHAKEKAAEAMTALNMQPTAPPAAN